MAAMKKKRTRSSTDRVLDRLLRGPRSSHTCIHSTCRDPDWGPSDDAWGAGARVPGATVVYIKIRSLNTHAVQEIVINLWPSVYCKWQPFHKPWNKQTVFPASMLLWCGKLQATTCRRRWIHGEAGAWGPGKSHTPQCGPRKNTHAGISCMHACRSWQDGLLRASLPSLAKISNRPVEAYSYKSARTCTLRPSKTLPPRYATCQA